MTATTVQLTFWNKYSNDASINSMMLNTNANELEESDRMDILNSLPDFTDMIVVDIGSGIGRFTTNFAEKAKHVISSDFIESFIEKNKMRNASFNNISYQVNDALSLQLEDASVDLMFTNWLMMYLNNNEVIEFLLKTMKALKPNKFLHLRESCTESSTTKSAKGSMHVGSNPTHYRHASVYIQLLQQLRWRDENGLLWGFKIYFSESVPTYIEAVENWRQVHWLCEKVKAQEGTGIENPTALSVSISQWMILQSHIESMLSEKKSWADKIFEKALEKIQFSDNNILTYSPRLISPFLYVDSDFFVQKTMANVWSIELNTYSYCERLTHANEMKNKRVRYSWAPSLNDALIHWRSKNVQFQGFVATEFLLTTDESALENLSHILAPNSSILFVEPALTIEDFKEKCVPIIERHFELVSIEDATLEDDEECQKKQEFNCPGHNAKWLLVHARLN